MSENADRSPAGKTRAASRASRHPVILRVSSLVVASILSLLLINAVVPPIVADQSDRAVVNAPVTLLTAPIDGEIDSLTLAPVTRLKPVIHWRGSRTFGWIAEP
jgi:hypothetical protein